MESFESETPSTRDTKRFDPGGFTPDQFFSKDVHLGYGDESVVDKLPPDAVVSDQTSKGSAGYESDDKLSSGS